MNAAAAYYRNPPPAPPAPVEDNGWRGFASRPDPAFLPAGLASRIENKRCSGGGCETRKGCYRPPWLNNGPIAWESLHGVVEFKDPHGIPWVLLAANGGVYRCAQDNAPIAVALPPGVTLMGRVLLRQAFDSVFLFRLGVNAPPLRLQTWTAGFEHLLPDWDKAATYTGTAEVQWGPWLTVEDASYADGVGTVATTEDHGLATGQDVVFKTGSDGAGTVHGRFTIRVLDARTFEFDTATDPSAWEMVSPMTEFWGRSGTPTAGIEPQNEPAAWSRLDTILPGGVDAVYINNRLVVATSYNPAARAYTGKAEYLLASDLFDPAHTGGVNAALRSDTGGGDAIVSLVKLNDNQLLLLKERSTALLAGVQSPAQAGNISGITHTTLDDTQGCAGRRAAALCGRDVVYLSPKRGLASVGLTDQNKVQGKSEPFSAEVQDLFDTRVNHRAAAGASFAWWNSRLYAALPVDGSQVNNTVLVYNFINQAFESLDSGPGAAVAEFFLAQCAGEERLFFLGNDRSVYLAEELWHADQTAEGLAPIADRLVTRGYPLGGALPARGILAVETWNPKFTVAMLTDGRNESAPTALTNRTRDRQKYRRPWNAARWPLDNHDRTHANPWREDYSVVIPPGLVDDADANITDENGDAIEPGAVLLDGVVPNRLQAAAEPILLPPRPHARHAQLDITNTQGRLALLGVSFGTRAVSHWRKQAAEF